MIINTFNRNERNTQGNLLAMSVFFCLLNLGEVVQAYYSKPIFLFQNDPGMCNTVATHWIHDEYSSLTDENTHIVAGLTWSKSAVTGTDMSGTSGSCFQGWTDYTTKTGGIPFVVWGNSDFSAYGKTFFT